MDQSFDLCPSFRSDISEVHSVITLLTAYGSLGRHVWHRACTRVRHSALCAATAHDFHPNASRSFSTIRRHVLGLPIDLFPTCVQFITIRQSFVYSNRRIWPIKLHRLALMMSVILFISTFSYSFSVEIVLGQNIRRIRRKHLL